MSDQSTPDATGPEEVEHWPRELAPIWLRLHLAGIRSEIGRTVYGILLHIDLPGRSWIVVAESELRQGSWYVGLVDGDEVGGTVLSDCVGGDWPREEAIEIIREHVVAFAPHLVGPDPRKAKPLTYEEARKDAARAQGLDPITARLTAEGITHHVDQTGGFCMVIRIPLQGRAWVGVTSGAEFTGEEADRGRWFMGFYTDDQCEGVEITDKGLIDWASGDHYFYMWDPDDAVAIVRSYIDEPSRAAAVVRQYFDREPLDSDTNVGRTI